MRTSRNEPKRAGVQADAVRFADQLPMFDSFPAPAIRRSAPKLGSSARALRLAVLLVSVIGISAVCVSKGGDVVFVQDTTPVTDDLVLIIEATRADIELFRGEPGTVITQLEAGNRDKITHRVRPGGTIPTPRLLIETFIPTEYAARSRAIVRLWIPDHTQLEVTGDDVSVDIRGPLANTIAIDGTINLTRGDATFTDVVGDFEINTGQGGITLNRVEGEYDAETGRGSIFLRGAPTASSLSRLETGAGSIFAELSRAPDLPVTASAGRGAILLHDGEDPISGADITVSPVTGPAALELTTANGIIDIRR